MLKIEDFRKKIADVLKLPPSAIQDHTDFIKDLGIDSLKLLQLINEIEVYYNIEIDDAQIDKLNNLISAYEYIKQLINIKT